MNAVLAAYLKASPVTAEHDEIEEPAILVSAYGDERWPILPPDPVEFLIGDEKRAA